MRAQYHNDSLIVICLFLAHAQHRADILAVVPAPDGEAVFASGVDPAVALFKHTQVQKGFEGWQSRRTCEEAHSKGECESWVEALHVLLRRHIRAILCSCTSTSVLKGVAVQAHMRVYACVRSSVGTCVCSSALLSGHKSKHCLHMYMPQCVAMRA